MRPVFHDKYVSLAVPVTCESRSDEVYGRSYQHISDGFRKKDGSHLTRETLTLHDGNSNPNTAERTNSFYRKVGPYFKLYQKPTYFCRSRSRIRSPGNHGVVEFGREGNNDARPLQTPQPQAPMFATASLDSEYNLQSILFSPTTKGSEAHVFMYPRRG